MLESTSQSLAINRVAMAQRWGHWAALIRAVPLSTWQWLIRLALVLWLVHSLAQLLWLLLPSPQVPAPNIQLSAASGQASASGSNVPAIDIEQLKNLTPFGAQPVVEVAPEPASATGIEDEAADTQLNLVLRGVLASNNEQAARAVIASGDRQEVYAVGDKLPVGNNVSLSKVLDLRVIINNNGKYESLWLFKDDPNSPKIASPQSQRPAYTPPPQTQPSPYLGPPGEVGYGPNPHTGPIPDPSAAAVSSTLSDVVGMSIYRENGQVVGYKIRPGRNAEMFHSLGLQADDIVTAVNGMPLDNPGKVMEIYKNMSNATSANLEIRRGGSVINLDIVLN